VRHERHPGFSGGDKPLALHGIVQPDVGLGFMPAGYVGAVSDFSGEENLPP
jgi:hypothetical protein